MKLLRTIETEKPVYIETLSKYGYDTIHESGFCFSHDGKSLLNIETVISSSMLNCEMSYASNPPGNPGGFVSVSRG